MRVTRSALLSILCASTLASAATAQGFQNPTVSLGFMAGPSTPVGMTDGLYDGGHHLAGFAELPTPASWIKLRLGGGYQRLGTVNQETQYVEAANCELRASFAMWSGIAGLVLRAPKLQTAVRPYALVGYGSYWLNDRGLIRCDGTEQTSWSSWTQRVNGIDAGLGFEAQLTRFVVFAEARYQRVGPGPLRFVPISVGFRL